MPDEPREFSRGAEALIGDFRGIRFTEPPRMRRRPVKGMEPLIETLLVKYQIGRHSCEQTIRDHWPEIVGTANAAYSHPVRIERGRSLLVLVSHSVVRNELFMHRESVLEKVKNLPGCEEVQDVNFRAG
jgi:Dna[CI] antecedent, DciA